jgi:hypothetical protein
VCRKSSCNKEKKKKKTHTSTRYCKLTEAFVAKDDKVITLAVKLDESVYRNVVPASFLQPPFLAGRETPERIGTLGKSSLGTRTHARGSRKIPWSSVRIYSRWSRCTPIDDASVAKRVAEKINLCGQMDESRSTMFGAGLVLLPTVQSSEMHRCAVCSELVKS